MVQRDPTVWSDPHAFKADRFGSKARPEVVPSPERRVREGNTEPLPTLCAGIPLGSLQDDAYSKHSHSCVFGRLMQPLLKRWVQKLVGDFEFALESNGVAVGVSESIGTDVDPMLVVRLPPEALQGGPNSSVDMLPKFEKGMRLAAFEFRSDDAAARYARDAEVQRTAVAPIAAKAWVDGADP